MLFQFLHSDYYEARLKSYDAMGVSLKDHLDHCVDALRQELECISDTGFVPFVWVRYGLYPYPDFSTKHKCKDSNKIRDWEAGFGITKKDWEGIQRPNGQEELPFPP